MLRTRNWTLLYATHRDGISLHTLMRKAERQAPTVLVVRDGGGALFGALVTEAWHTAPRFYGTGESFVFQVRECGGRQGCWGGGVSGGGGGMPLGGHRDWPSVIAGLCNPPAPSLLVVSARS